MCCLPLCYNFYTAVTSCYLPQCDAIKIHVYIVSHDHRAKKEKQQHACTLTALSLYSTLQPPHWVITLKHHYISKGFHDTWRADDLYPLTFVQRKSKSLLYSSSTLSSASVVQAMHGLIICLGALSLQIDRKPLFGGQKDG